MINLKKHLFIFSILFCFSQTLQAYPIYYSRLKNPETNQKIHLIGDVHEMLPLATPHKESEAELLNSLKKIISDNKSPVQIIVEQDKNSTLLPENDIENVGFAELALFADKIAGSKMYIRELFAELNQFQKEQTQKNMNSSINYVVRDRDILYTFLIISLYPNTCCNLFEKDNLIQKKFLATLNSFEKKNNNKKTCKIVKEIKDLISNSNSTQDNNEKVLSLVTKLGCYSLDTLVENKINANANAEFIFYLGAAHSIEITKSLIDAGFKLENEISKMPEPMIEYLRNDNYYAWCTSMVQLITYPHNFILSKDTWENLSTKG